MKIALDVHTHTIASGHAYSTISELVAEAKNKELKLLGIVEHDVGIPGTCDPIYFKNYHVVPRNFNGLDLILGIEINILDHDGKLSIDENLYQYVDYCMAGIHFHCYQPGTIEQNTHAVIETIKNPHISVIVHPDGEVYRRGQVDARNGYLSVRNGGGTRGFAPELVKAVQVVALNKAYQLVRVARVGGVARLCQAVGPCLVVCRRVAEQERIARSVSQEQRVVLV